MSNDFTLREGGRKIELHSQDIRDWNITFADTGLHSNIGQRLLRVRRYLENERNSWPTTPTVSPVCPWMHCWRI